MQTGFKDLSNAADFIYFNLRHLLDCLTVSTFIGYSRDKCDCPVLNFVQLTQHLLGKGDLGYFLVRSASCEQGFLKAQLKVESNSSYVDEGLLYQMAILHGKTIVLYDSTPAFLQ